MTRLLNIALFTLAISLFGAAGAIVTSGEASPPPVVPDFSTTTTAPATTTSTTAPKRVEIGTAVSIVRRTTTTTQPATTTTEAPLPVSERVLAVARAEVGKTGPYAEGGFWCAKFTSWVAEQAKVEGFERSDSPNRLHAIAKQQGRLTDTPQPGYLVFIDLTGQSNANDYITHVEIVESVNGDEITDIAGNADDSGLVTRQVRRVGDGYVIAFAPFEASR